MIAGRIASALASCYCRRIQSWDRHSVAMQKAQWSYLIHQAKDTRFGKEHGFREIRDYSEYRSAVPVRDYEAIKPFIQAIAKGEKDVLWPGLPIYFAKTSGTTSGVKYIPITPASMPNHTQSARLSLLRYIERTGNTDFINGKYIFISGSPELETHGVIPTGRLSGIVHHHVPFYVNRNKLPAFTTNCIPDWEEKLEKIIDETLVKKMTLISGIPPWVEMYFERLIRRTGKNSISEIFPHFSLFVHGGVNYSLYAARIDRLIGRKIDTLETYPASEGFIAFQDEFPFTGLRLIPDAGIFYEFIPLEYYFDENPPRLWLEEVETGVEYALIMNTNAGLWGYSLGDTVRFLSKDPYRLVVTGRVSHHTSAFGEHVTEEEAVFAIGEAERLSGALVKEFTLAPLFENPGGLPCHQWIIEFEMPPTDHQRFAGYIDESLQSKNPYYKDLVQGNILQKAIVTGVPQNTFRNYLKSVGKLGGQNKVPHLSNDRKIAAGILSIL